MRRALLLLALPCFVVACATSPTGGVVLPGKVDAPPPVVVPEDARLTGTVWSWQGTQRSDGSRALPEAPERYTLEFQPGGTASIRADCNRGSTSYRLDGGALSFGPIALTRAMCPPGSRDADFLRDLQAVSGQAVRGNDLVLSLKGESGSMRFAAPRP